MFDFMLMALYYLGVTLALFMVIVIWIAIFYVIVHEVREMRKELKQARARNADDDYLHDIY